MKLTNCKINYDQKMQEQISVLSSKPKLLLHSCCGPCSSACIERLLNFFDITIFYYNPNIYPKQEFEKRLFNQNKVIKFFNKVKIVSPTYDEQEYLQKIKGLEGEKEGGSRCDACFELRLFQTALFAKEHGYDYFGTTLTVSSHKNEQHINKIGEQISQKLDIKFLYSDFKKHEGYKRSIELSKQIDLYRQNYCGCRFSIRQGEDSWDMHHI